MSGATASMRHWFWLLLAFAFALRLGAALALPSIHQADEIFQTLEPAHLLWFEYGVVSWEWRLGIRSWLLPGLLAPVIGGASALGMGPVGYQAVVAALMSLTSLSVVAVGVGFGARAYGRAGALLLGALGAVWFECVYFAPKTLTEVMAAHVLIIGVWLIHSAPRRLGLIGVLLGITFILRFHTAPMVFLAAIWVCGADVKARWPKLLAGAAIPLLFQALLDWATLGTPLQSVWLNFWVNVVAARSDIYGVVPFYWYPGGLFLAWGGAFPLLIGAALLGARRAPLLGWMVLVHLGAHSLIGHKELRFLYPIMPLLIVLAGLGLCRVLARLRGFAEAAPRVMAPALVGICAVSLIGATNPGYIGNWRSLRGGLEATDFLRGQEEICGIGVVNGPDWKGYWTPTGGYVRLHRDVPMYPGVDAAALNALAPRFNYASLPRPVGDKLAGYARQHCWDFNIGGTIEADDPEWCVYRRPGMCAPDPAAAINPALIQADQ